MNLVKGKTAMTQHNLNESSIEQFAIELLKSLGWEYVFAPDIAPDGKSPERNSYEDVLLTERLQNAIRRINPNIPIDAQEEALKEIQRINLPDLLANNEAFHRMLTEGINISYQKDGDQRGDLVWLIDFKNPENNEFIVTNQFTVIENGNNKRPDIVLFVNGIPLVVIELKNPADENATLKSAYNQIQTYKQTIPSLFKYNEIIVISDGLEAKAGSLSAGFTRFMAWKSADGKKEASNLVSQLETLIKGMLNKETLLDLIRHFIVFEKSKREDPKTGQLTISTVKKMAAYHQYYAVNRAVESTLRAAGISPLPGGDSGAGKQIHSSEGRGGYKRKIIPYNPKLKELAKKLRKNMTLSEVLLWNELKQKKMLGFDFDRQRPIDEYIVDFYCKDLMLAIEIDGDSHHHEEARVNDIKRQKRLELLGVRFLRFDDLEVKKDINNVLRTIQIWIEEHKDDLIGREPTPNPSQEGNLTFQKGDTASQEGNLTFQKGDTASQEGNLTFQEGSTASREGNLTFQEGNTASREGNLTFQEGNTASQEGNLTFQEGDTASREGNLTFQEGDTASQEGNLTFQEGSTASREGNLTFQEGNTASQMGNLTFQEGNIASREGNLTFQEGNTASQMGNFSSNQDNLLMESPESYGVAGVQSQPKGDRKGGVIWHTQGSGKSLSMVFFTGKIVLALNNPTVLVITDRNDLDDQLFDTFAASTQLLRQEPKQVESREDLKEKLKVASGGVIFSTIQKFQPEEGNVYETLSERENIVVIADEAHRTQYGFKAKIDKETGAIKYGFAKYMRDALPNATYIGFTGTPIESTDVNTPAVFGNYIDVYDIAQAVEDGATVPIYYESRLAKVNLSEEGKQLIEELEEDLKQDDLTETQKAKAKWTQLEALIGSKNRIKNIAKDIVNHFEARQEVFEGKGMIVTMSRRIAAELYEEIINIKPEWHSDDLNKGVIKVVMTSASSDGPKIAKHHTTKQQRKILADRMKDPEDELKLVIVRDMWLTGFDVPMLHTLYIDKPMQGHNLMQAIARVNRVYKDKPGGLVVDYLGIASDLKKALSFYSDSGGKGDPAILQEQAVELMLEKLEVVSQMFHEFPSTGGVPERRGGFPYKEYFDADTSKKLSIILSAEEHILSLEDGKKRFINEVTALSKAFAIAIPHERAMDVKDEVAFFQAVKARLAKFDAAGSKKTDEGIETTIRQVIDKALVSEQVIDIFDAAGIKKPDISILSEEFLLELKGMEHKNVAMEVLKKLLNDEIKSRAKKNLVKSKTLMEMLENAIKKYHNKILTAVEVIDELIQLSKEIVNMDNEAKALGLTDFEYAFYTAVADNKSARELMQKEKLRELAVILTERVKQNTTIDWTIKESVRAKLKVIIKRTLRQFGYPPDMQQLATETVLKQAELIANELTNE
jgi:type I restriction enzyme R subunit